MTLGPPDKLLSRAAVFKRTLRLAIRVSVYGDVRFGETHHDDPDGVNYVSEAYHESLLNALRGERWYLERSRAQMRQALEEISKTTSLATAQKTARNALKLRG